MIKPIVFVTACMLMACNCNNAAADSVQPDPTSVLYLGTYKEVLTDPNVEHLADTDESLLRYVLYN